MKRYCIDEECPLPEPYKHGEWVKFEDVEVLLAELNLLRSQPNVEGTSPIDCIRALVNQWREFGPEGFDETLEAAATRFGAPPISPGGVKDG